MRPPLASTTSCARRRSSSRLGVSAVILFGIPEEKDEEGSGAWDDDGIVQRALRALRAALPGAVLLTDVCLCEYTAHGHCGVRPRRRGRERRSRSSCSRAPRSATSRRAPTSSPERHDGRPRRRDPRRARRAGTARRRSWPTRRSTPRRSTGRSARRPTRRRRSATGAATRWIPRTSARRCASASSTWPRAPTC